MRQLYARSIVSPTDRRRSRCTFGGSDRATEFSNPTTNTARYLTRPLAPLLAGATLRGALGTPFVIAGALKSVYDVGLYILFRNTEVKDERAAKPAAAG